MWCVPTHELQTWPFTSRENPQLILNRGWVGPATSLDSMENQTLSPQMSRHILKEQGLALWTLLENMVKKLEVP